MNTSQLETSHQRVSDFLPLTPAVLHVLMALAAGPRHGYAIMQHVAKSGEGRVRMGPGTLYGTLRRLEASGLVLETACRPDREDDDERRRYYTLTEVGEAVLRGETARLGRVVRVARACLATST